MYGVTIKEGPMDWQIIQQEKGVGKLYLSGSYQVPQAAVQIGTETACPVVRILSEEDNSQIIPWTKAEANTDVHGISGTWNISLTIPAGGLYRIETGLDTQSTQPDLSWIFRGDVRLHIGIGDIFIIAGQSNSSGYGKDSAFDPPDLLVHLFRNRGAWDLACHPMNESTFASDKVNAEMGLSGVSPYLSFGKRFHCLSHYPVGFVSAALGGSPISRWDITQNGDLFNNMISRVKSCQNKASGILWYQGCSDTTPEQAKDYFESFERLVAETRKKLGYDIPFFTYQLNRQIGGIHDESWGIVREAQRLAADKIPGVYILPTIHCTLSDGIHNNAHSSIMLGEKMARLCGHILYRTPKFFAPELKLAVWENNKIQLTFANIQRGFIHFGIGPQDCGFTVMDSDGPIPVTAFSSDMNCPCLLHLTLERVPVKNVCISFGWEADPVKNPIVDEVTYLPPLSFYKVPVLKYN